MLKSRLAHLTLRRLLSLNSIAMTMGPGSYPGLWCSGESWFWIPAGGVVKIDFNHTQGDLDLFAYDGAKRQVSSSQSTGNTEQVVVPRPGYAQVVGYGGATNRYRLTIQSS